MLGTYGTNVAPLPKQHLHHAQRHVVPVCDILSRDLVIVAGRHNSLI